jgi:hypothetical protein
MNPSQNQSYEPPLGPLAALPVEAANIPPHWSIFDEADGCRQASSSPTASARDEREQPASQQRAPTVVASAKAGGLKANHDQVRPTDAPPEAIEDAERRLLLAVLRHPLLPSSRYPKLAGMSTRRTVDARGKLVGKGFLRVREIDASSAGRTSLLLEITPTGRTVLEQAGGPSVEGGAA